MTVTVAWSLHRQEWNPRSWDEVVGCFPPSAWPKWSPTWRNRCTWPQKPCKCCFHSSGKAHLHWGILCLHRGAGKARRLLWLGGCCASSWPFMAQTDTGFVATGEASLSPQVWAGNSPFAMLRALTLGSCDFANVVTWRCVGWADCCFRWGSCRARSCLCVGQPTLDVLFAGDLL